MKVVEILLLAGVCIVGAVLILAVIGAFACLIGAVSEEISNKVLATFVALLLLVACTLTGCGVAWGINEVLDVIENWDREKGIGLLSDAEESELIADVREKGSRLIVVDEGGKMHEYYVLTESDKSSDSQEDSDDTEVRYFPDGVTITKGF